MHALCISVNECIGMGMILNGHPLYGLQGDGGEFGHVRVTEEDILCYCGKTGCTETLASGRAIIKAACQAIKSGKSDHDFLPVRRKSPRTRLVVEAATHDDIFAIELLQQAGEKIGEALAALIHCSTRS